MPDHHHHHHHHQPPSPLLALPFELRLQIYAYTLTHDPSSATSTINPSLLFTNRQIAHEATPLLYQHNTFLAHSSLLTSLPRLLLLHASAPTPKPVTLRQPVTAPRVLTLPRRFHVHVRLDIDARFTRAQATAAFSGVEVLEIHVFQSMYGSCGFGVLRVFEGVRGVGSARVRGSVGDGRYAGWLAGVVMQKEGSVEGEGFREEMIGGSVAWDAWRRRHG